MAELHSKHLAFVINACLSYLKSFGIQRNEYNFFLKRKESSTFLKTPPLLQFHLSRLVFAIDQM